METIELQAKIDTANSAQTLSEMKSALKELIKTAGGVEVGSQNFEVLAENIRSVEDRIKESTKSFKNQAPAIEQNKNSVSFLRKELKQLIDQLNDVEPGSKAFVDLSNRINETEGRIGSLNTQFQTLRGNGVERLSTSFGLLTDGLESFDFGKIQEAFRGIGGAMSAIPIFLIIEGVKLLIENFEKVVSFGKELFNVFSDEERAIKETTTALEDQKKATASLVAEMNREIAVLEAQEASYAKINAARKESLQAQLKQAEIEQQLNELKLKEIENNDSFYESILRLGKGVQELMGNQQLADGLDKVIADNKKERSADVEKALAEGGEKIKDIQNGILLNDIDTQKKAAEEAKKARDLRIQNIFDDRQRELAQIRASFADQQEEYKNNAEALKQIQIKYLNDRRSINAKYDAQEAEAQKEFNAERDKLQQDALTMFSGIVQKEADLKRAQDEKDIENYRYVDTLKTSIESQGVQERDGINANNSEKYRQRLISDAQYSEGVATSAAQSAQALSDTVFAIKSENLKKGSAEELAAAKKQFEINKALQISAAIINGAQAVTAILAVPDFTLGIASAARIAAAGFTTIATVAKIAATKFQAPGGGGAASAGGGASLSGGGATGALAGPSNQTFNNNISGKAFDKNAVNQSPGIPPINVAVTEINKVQKKVAVTESLSTFG